MFGRRGNDDGSRATPEFRPPAQPVKEAPEPSAAAPAMPAPVPVATQPPVARRPVEAPPLVAEPRRVQRERSESCRTALRVAFDQLHGAGEARLYYLPGEQLLGDDNEGTVDSSHPTDLGFLRQADAFEPILRTALGESARN